MPRSTPLRAAAVAALALLSATAAAQAAPKDEVKAAVQKLADASSYTFTTTVEGGGGGGATGKVEKDGYLSMAVQARDNTVNIVKKGDHVAMETDDGWKSADELKGQPQGRMVAAMARTKTPVDQAEQVLADAPDVTKGTEGSYGVDLPEAAAKKLMVRGGGRRGGGAAPEVANAKATVKFTVADGTLTKMSVHMTGTVTVQGEDRDIDRTTTTEFKDVGSTKADVPPEAKAKLDAAGPTTKP